MKRITICPTCFHTKGLKIEPKKPIGEGLKTKCPHCGSEELWQSGYVYHGAGGKRYKCKRCLKFFVVPLPPGLRVALRERARACSA